MEKSVSRKMNKYKILFSNTGVFAIGNMLVKLISLFLMPLYTSSLQTEEYGIAELINSGVEIIIPIISLCIVDALYRFSIDEDADCSALFANATFILAIGYFFAFATYKNSSFSVLRHSELRGFQNTDIYLVT